jgi:hypothetical protein
MAIGFILALRLSGANEEKINQMLETYSFGLTKPGSLLEPGNNLKDLVEEYI